MKTKTLQPYSFDVAVLKDYGGIKRKLVLCRCVRTAGVEIRRKSRPRGTANIEKLDNNISRAKAKLFEYAYCNPWDWFITLTIDPKKFDRTDLKGYYKQFSQWLRDYGKKHGIKIDYLFVPELHEDGLNWHMHGFIKGLPENHLEPNKNGYLHWKAYGLKFGFNSLDKIRDMQRISSYITKYISKDLSDCVKELNAKMYYCSKGLNNAEVIEKGSLNCEFRNPDFENDWVKVRWFDGSVPLQTLKELFV